MITISLSKEDVFLCRFLQKLEMYTLKGYMYLLNPDEGLNDSKHYDNLIKARPHAAMLHAHDGKFT